MRKVIELHDKYLQYVSECFVNHSLFHKVINTLCDLCSYCALPRHSVEIIVPEGCVVTLNHKVHCSMAVLL